MIVTFRAIGRQEIHPLFPVQKQNLADTSLKIVARWYTDVTTSADKTGNGLLSTGNRKVHLSISASTRRLLGNVVEQHYN